MDNQQPSNIPPAGPLISQSPVIVPPVFEEKPPKKKLKTMLLGSIAVLIIGITITAIVYYPKYQAAKYADAASPIIAQLKSEIKLLKAKTLDPNFYTTDIDSVVKRHTDNLKQLEDSKKKIEDLDKQYSELKGSSKTSSVDSEVKALFDLADEIVTDDTQDTEVRQQTAQALGDVNKKVIEFDNYLRQDNSTFVQAVLMAREVEKTANESLAKISQVRPEKDQRQYVETVTASLRAISSGHARMAEALFKKDTIGYRKAQNDMNNKLNANNTQIKENTDHYYTDSDVAQSFAKFEKDAGKVSSELQNL